MADVGAEALTMQDPPGRINVLHLTDKLTFEGSLLHGVTRLFSWWIPEHDPNRFNVMAGSLRGRDRAGEYLESLGIRMFYFERGKFDPLTVRDVLRVIDAEKLDVLHLHGYGSTNFGRLGARIRGIPCIVHEHIYDENMPFYQGIADRMLAGMTPHAIAISRHVQEFLVRHRSIPREKIEVIYNGIPLKAFSSPRLNGRRAAWRAEHGVPEMHRVVGIVGRLHPLKGLGYFMEAAQQIARAHEPVSFALVGDGELMDELRAQAADFGIAERVAFLGHREDVPQILRDVDIKVISSLSEGGPLVLFEAMAAGCAIVCTDSCGLAEVIREGENGFLIPPKDPAAIADRVLRLLENPELLERVAEQGRREADKYDTSSSVRAIEKTYLSLVGPRRGPAGPRP